MKQCLLSVLSCSMLLPGAVFADTATTQLANNSDIPSTQIRQSEMRVQPPPPQETPEIKQMLGAMDKATTWHHPDQFGERAGLRHLFAGEYAKALKFFRIGARYADKLSQASIGMMYLNGRGVSKDPAISCAWLTLAAERKYPSFVIARNRVCGALSSAQHKRAAGRYAELVPRYGDKVAKKRMALQLKTGRTVMTGTRVGFDYGVESVSGATDGMPRLNFANKDFWAAWRWEPKKYFASRDAMWFGTVTVGPLQTTKPLPTATAAKPRAR